ncbi:MAG: class I SAM-dependent rRNA methyltransferase [Puniceicoccales bacterium]|jgi:23S rRNA (cytosine1962-C5)-methyltransferase|nr:class I SAM-dependent rRNA methyltransferase [Puniceicoccales bacterium]
MKFVRLKSSRPCRVLSGHPWAFAGEIDRQNQKLEDGDCVELRDVRGRSLGSGLWSNRSQIAWRRYAREMRLFDRKFLREALSSAVSRRSPGQYRRLVWSEADHLPGLVVDQFDRAIVVQVLTAGMACAQNEIALWLKDNLSPREIIFRNDAASRQYDGLELEVHTESGDPFVPDWFNIEGVEYFLDLSGGQKTGFYLDQREQHLQVAKYAHGRRALDGFCNQGGFSLQMARAGAASVEGIDSSEECVTAAARNAERNKLAAKFTRANMFDWFTENRTQKFDLIVLDPPPFAKNKEAMAGAMRGYKELNLRALRLLNPGGILATYSCSQRVSTSDFLAMLGDAAADAKREARVLEITGQPSDHPVLLNFPESHYLKGAILQAE